MEPVTSKSQSEPGGVGVTPDRSTHKAPPSPVVLLILAAVVGAGFLCLLITGPYHGVLDALFNSIGLLTHDSGWAFDPRTETKSGLFRVLAVFGPLLTAATVTYLLTDWLGRAVIRLRVFVRVFIRHRKCVALIGLTDNSFALAASLALAHRQGGGGEIIVPLIFTEDNSGPLVERCSHYGIATYSRHAHAWLGGMRRTQLKDDPAGTRPLNPVMNRAQDLISFLPSAAAQVDFLAELQGWAPRGGADCRAWILLEDRGLTQRLQSQTMRLAGGPVTPRLLAISTLAARQLLMSQQFDTLADAFGQAQVHLAIYGMGDLGRAIVKEAAQLYVTRPALHGTKLRISFFDADAPAAECALFAEDPGLRNVIDIDGHTMRIDAAGLLEAQVGRLPAHVTGHIVTLEDGEAAFSAAVSLRRWLLEPPQHLDAAWLAAHHAAPLFVRVSSWHGLGRLFYNQAAGQALRGGSAQHGAAGLSAQRGAAGLSAQHGAAGLSARHSGAGLSALPDGIVGFGAIEGLFGAPELGVQHQRCLLDTQSEKGAMAVHDAYRRTRTDVAVSPAPRHARAGEIDWHKLSPQLRESNFRAYDHIAIKARAVGHRVVPRDTRARGGKHGGEHGGQPADIAPPHLALDGEAIETLEQLEHLRYLAERTADGWRYAPRRLDAVCVHPDLVDWADLDMAERQLDRAQIHALDSIAGAAGERFANALVIGVIGHRPDRIGAGADAVRAALAAELARLLAENSGRAPLLLTALAPGADTLAAQAAQTLHIPFMVPLPLPYELYQEDFTQTGELETFHRLAAAAELHVELPLRFGRASQMTTGRQPAPGENQRLRACQYALAGAYIVERAHVLIAVRDGQGSRGIGGTDDVLSWWNGVVPEAYATPSHFFVRPPTRGAAIVIDTLGGIGTDAFNTDPH